MAAHFIGSTVGKGLGCLKQHNKVNIERSLKGWANIAISEFDPHVYMPCMYALYKLAAALENCQQERRARGRIRIGSDNGEKISFILTFLPLTPLINHGTVKAGLFIRPFSLALSPVERGTTEGEAVRYRARWTRVTW